MPAGFYETHWYTQTQVEPAPSASAATGARKLILAAALYALACALLCRRIARDTLSPFEKGGWRETLTLAVMLAAGLALRLYVAGAVPGYDVDIGCFRAWATQMAQSGPVDFYQSVSFCDYPPGYLWILWLLGLIGRALGGVSEWLVKIPSVAADITLCALLYKSARARGHREALALCLLYAFNPMTFAAGAAWGQTDALMTLLVFLAVDAAGKKRWKTRRCCMCAQCWISCGRQRNEKRKSGAEPLFFFIKIEGILWKKERFGCLCKEKRHDSAKKTEAHSCEARRF